MNIPEPKYNIGDFLYFRSEVEYWIDRARNIVLTPNKVLVIAIRIDLVERGYDISYAIRLFSKDSVVTVNASEIELTNTLE